MTGQLAGSEKMAGLICIKPLIEPSLAQMSMASMHGIYLGPSKIYGIPIFLDFDRLINPHIFVTGITGAGKTFLTKNLMLKLFSVIGATVILIDFTGEYREFAEAAGCSKLDSGRIIDGKLLYMDLHTLKDSRKVAKAIDLLDAISEDMRSRDTDGKSRRLFVILDESWKLVRKSSSFETLIREGRKYRVGIILASQLLEDVNAAFLSNIATVFIFRIQNDASLVKISDNYGLSDAQVEQIKNFEVGSCMLIQLNKDGVETFAIRKIAGMQIKKSIAVMLGSDDMSVELSLEAFSKLVNELCKGDAQPIVLSAKEAGYMRLDELIRLLVLQGADRKQILRAMRKTGIADDDIADAFAAAILQIGSQNGATG